MQLPGSQLYAPHRRIFVKHAWGRYQAQRWTIIALLLGTFFALPWLRLGGRPAVFLDIPARKFDLLGVTFWPQDAYLLTLALITCAVALFAATTLWGRLWCGYLCPQMVGTSIFLEIERRVEGDRAAQMRLARGAWTPEKLRKHLTKHGLFILISGLFSFNLVSYFVSMPVLLDRTIHLTLSAANLSWLACFFALAYSDFGRFREQLCHGPCPYGRFQGVMLDSDSRVLTYDLQRGEPRAFFRKGQERRAGDCVDCKLCVDVCPAGIDLRQGPQFECVSCMRCADACDGVMTKLGMPRGLIRVGSENEFQGKPTVFWRKRLFAYLAILAVTTSLIGYEVLHHPVTQVDILRNRSFVYQRLPDGRIANVYMIKALNMDRHAHTYRVSVEGLEGQFLGTQPIFKAAGGEVVQESLALAVRPDPTLQEVTRFRFVLTDAETGQVLSTVPSTFLMPDPEDDRERGEPPHPREP